MIFKGYSKAKYSSWLYYSPYHTLFDAGEGINTILEEKIIAINNVLLSHGHTDHYTGLINILMTKFGHYYSTGEFNELSIYYPKNDNALLSFIEYIKKFYKLDSDLAHLKINWVEVKPNEKYKFNTKLNTYLETFEIEHTKDVMSIGYKIIEKRRKLKSEFANYPSTEVKRLIDKLGRDNVIYIDDKITLTFCGDSINTPFNKFLETDILIHEATFLKEEDRFGQLDSTFEEAVLIGLNAKVKHLILTHISTRYKSDEIKNEILRLTTKYSINFKIDVIIPGRIFEI